jgi:hypothetical protein
MICWYALLWRNVAEHSFLLVIVAAHSLAFSAFLLSDEFPQIKVAVRAVFFNKLLVVKLWKVISKASFQRSKTFRWDKSNENTRAHPEERHGSVRRCWPGRIGIRGE